MTAPNSTQVYPNTINVFVDPDLAKGRARKLEFLSKNLGEDIDLLLMFKVPKKPGEIFADLFPIYWKIIPFYRSGICTTTLDYSGEIGWMVPQVDHTERIAGHHFQRCEPGKKCTLKVNPNYDNYLTEAVSGKKGFIQCANSTEGLADIALGIYASESSKVEPILYWKYIDDGSIITTCFEPVLKIYAQRQYREAQLIRANIEPSLLWEGDITKLPECTTWSVVIDEESRRIKLEQA